MKRSSDAATYWPRRSSEWEGDGEKEWEGASLQGVRSKIWPFGPVLEQQPASPCKDLGPKFRTCEEVTADR